MSLGTCLHVRLLNGIGCAWDSYMASSDFEGDSKNTQLTLKTGDSVQVICKDESGWWMATDGESTGWVPSDFLQPVSESTTSDSSGEEDNDDVIGLNIPGGRVIHTEEYLAIDNYEAEDDSQVSFKEGCLITVVDKEEDGEYIRTPYLPYPSHMHVYNIVQVQSIYVVQE